MCGKRKEQKNINQKSKVKTKVSKGNFANTWSIGALPMVFEAPQQYTSLTIDGKNLLVHDYLKFELFENHIELVFEIKMSHYNRFIFKITDFSSFSRLFVLELKRLRTKTYIMICIHESFLFQSTG